MLMLYAYSVIAFLVLIFVFWNGFGKVYPEDRAKFGLFALAVSALWLPMLIFMAYPILKPL